MRAENPPRSPNRFRTFSIANEAQLDIFWASEALMERTRHDTRFAVAFGLLGLLLAMNVTAFFVAWMHNSGLLHGWMGWSVVPGPALMSVILILVIASIVNQGSKWKTVLAGVGFFGSSMVEFISIPPSVAMMLGLFLVNASLADMYSHRSLLAKVGFVVVCAYMSAVFFVGFLDPGDCARFWHACAIE